MIQGDILEIYNNLTIFSKDVLQSENQAPIKVWFDKEGVGSPLVFECKGNTVRLRLPVYYCLGLEDIRKGKESYLLPSDYDYLMNSLQKTINDPRSLEERTLISPENYGFDVYAIDIILFYKGPEMIGTIRFVSLGNWFFRFRTKLKYKL